MVVDVTGCDGMCTTGGDVGAVGAGSDMTDGGSGAGAVDVTRGTGENFSASRECTVTGGLVVDATGGSRGRGAVVVGAGRCPVFSASIQSGQWTYFWRVAK